MVRSALLILVGLAGCLSQGVFASAASPQLQVKVAGIKSDKGVIVVRIFSDEQGWLKNDKAIETLKLTPQGNEIATTIALKPGTYAVHVFQDENSNGKLDMKWLPPGPAEPWVVSNNAQGTMGPPSFKDAKVQIEADQTLQLSLQ